ncbi:MAG: TIM barrel protein [Anaerolineales bacterium]
MKNFPDLNGFFETSKKLGFQKIELNHQVNSTMLSHVRMDHTQFSSVHEPCPADISMSDLVKRDWLISSQDEDLRRRGVKAVKRSIDLAYELGAPVVVIHCGNVTMNMSLEGELRALLEAGKVQSDEYLEIKSQYVQSRKDLTGPRLRAEKRSLSELIKFADQFQVKLGLENRYHFMDIPSIDEIGELLNLAESTRLGFINAVGHARALDRLSFYSHEDWLQRYSSRMFGSHLHDVIGVTDHYAPGLGEIEFKFIANFLPENAFRTFEMLPGNTLAQVNVGLDLMIETGCIKYL